ncbi:MAG: methylated-DNA--[protein]-cysteine S-methyltransferase [Oscillospiraceae bacterium]
MSTRTIETPIGALTLTASADAVTAVRFGAQGARDASALLDAAEAQLHEYFARTRRTFDLPLDPRGTAFELRVWTALRTIPYGETRSYGAIAAAIGSPQAARAVGMANHRNPLPILIPCHRVIGADGSLTGYAGGLETKRRLLALEGITYLK